MWLRPVWKTKKNTFKTCSLQATEVVLLVMAHSLCIYIILLQADHFQKHIIIVLINF